MRVLAILLLLGTTSVWSEELPEGACQNWSKDRADLPRISVNAFTRARAEEAIRRIYELLSDDSGDFNFPDQEYRTEEGYVKGYLLWKEWVDARANREHDADEMISFCLHWSAMNYGPPDV